MNPPSNAGDEGSITGLGKSPGKGNGYALDYSCLESSRTEEPGGLQSWGLKEHNMTEQLKHIHARVHTRTHTHTHTYMHAHPHTHARTRAHTHTHFHDMKGAVDLKAVLSF